MRGLHYCVPAARYRLDRARYPLPHPSPPLPSNDVQLALIDAFFTHVWPLFPVIDLDDFHRSYFTDDASRSTSPLLLWSIFFVAANASPSLRLDHLRTDN